MNYEEKYKEALERFKSFKEKYYTKDTNFGDVIFDKTGEMQKDFESIFPELAESEDERMCKAALEGIKYLECEMGWDAINGIDILDVKEYLEKQKDIEDRWIEDRGQCFWNGVEEGKMLAEKQKEQKLPLMDGDTDTYFDDLRMTTKPLTSREWFEEGIRYAQRFQKEQKPAEWSEEDKETLKDIISGLKAQKLLIFAHENQGKAQMNARIDWLQSLPERFNLQPKEEWSEEDEKQIAQIERIVKNAGCAKMLQEKIHNWFDSLRPQYHGDVTMTEAYKMGKEAGEASHWKPSEEQMEALKRASMNEYLSAKQFDILVSLYEQLKNLM